MSALSDKLILAPSFVDALVFYEQETLYVGTTFTCQEILVVPPSALDNLGTPLDLEKYYYELPEVLKQLVTVSGYMQK